MGDFFKKIFGGNHTDNKAVSRSGHERKEGASEQSDASQNLRTEQASQEVSRRFGKALERLTDR
ncbi:MAG: hypothetical protein Q8P88_00725 [Candidatus Jorgensenbacteria bacterium]|nr:hypothetical protein [Candidatus Jorgensenbacteria bacterium]